MKSIESDEIKIGSFDISNPLPNSGINTLINQQIEGVSGLEVVLCCVS